MKKRTTEFFCHAFRLLKKDFRAIAKQTNKALVRNKYLAIIFWVIVITTAWFVIRPHDHSVVDYVRENRTQTQKEIAFQIGWWGDFAQYNLMGFIAIWLFGYFRKSRWFQRLAVATFYAALIAGLTCNALRFTTGRARPEAKVEDKFYGVPGVVKGWKYHGFPSGHTSTAMGMATPVATAAGIYGTPLLIFSSSVGVSRVYRLKHYPTDVLVGGGFGLFFGVATGWQLRRVRLRLKHRRKSRKQASAAAIPANETPVLVAKELSEDDTKPSSTISREERRSKDLLVGQTSI